MSKLIWGEPGSKKIEAGVDRGVLYTKNSTTEGGNGYAKGVAWVGLTGVTESPSGAEPTALYADNVKYLTLMSAEEFKVTVEAYTYPDEFAVCDGSANIAEGVEVKQQGRVPFGFSYRTKIGTDENTENAGYKIHIIYNGMASPSERAYSTINDSPEATTLSWEISTTPVSITGMKPTACLIIDSTKIAAAKLRKIEEALYGTADKEPTILLPDEIKAIIDAVG